MTMMKMMMIMMMMMVMVVVVMVMMMMLMVMMMTVVVMMVMVIAMVTMAKMTMMIMMMMMAGRRPDRRPRLFLGPPVCAVVVGTQAGRRWSQGLPRVDDHRARGSDVSSLSWTWTTTAAEAATASNVGNDARRVRDGWTWRVAAQVLLYKSERRGPIQLNHLRILHKRGRLVPQDPQSNDADERAVGAVPLEQIKGLPVDAVPAGRSALELRAPSDG